MGTLELRGRHEQPLPKIVWVGLAVSGTLALLGVLVPEAVMIGLFLGILPGIFIGIAPMMFTYMALGAAAWLASRGRPVTLRVALVALAIATPAFAIPFARNAPIRARVEALLSGDKSLKTLLRVPDTVALMLARGTDRTRAEPDTGCGAFCQRLLYNGAARRVVVAVPREAGERDDAALRVQAFAVERRGQCAPPPLSREDDGLREHPSPKGDVTRSRVHARIAAGECLVPVAGRVEDADLIVSERALSRAVNDPTEHPTRPDSDEVKARRLELVVQRPSGDEVLYRRTQITALLDFMPLVFGPLVMDGSKARMVILPTELSVNRYRDYGTSQGEILGSLFGDALRLPAADPPSPAGVMLPGRP